MRPRSFRLLIILACGLAIFPANARADAGTPLMWAGMFHLAIGNVLLGVAEGLLLAWLFSVPKIKAVGMMVPANYFSAWVGGLFIAQSIVRALPLDLHNAWHWFWVMVVVTYGLTLILEWPFVAWCFRGSKDWLRKSVSASLLLQSASYLVLFGWYWMASGTSLYTQMKIVPPAELSLPGSVLVYFIKKADGCIYERRLSGGDERKIQDLHSTNPNDRLFFRLTEHRTRHRDLMARVATDDPYKPKLIVVLPDLDIDGALDWVDTFDDQPKYDGPRYNYDDPASRLLLAKESPWEFHGGFWPIQGLSAANKSTGQRVHFAYETPFGAWSVRNAVQLAPGKVLFQLGDDQICAFDAATQRLALLWHGRGPAAALPMGAENFSK